MCIPNISLFCRSRIVLRCCGSDKQEPVARTHQRRSTCTAFPSGTRLMNPHMFGSPCSPAAPLGPALVAAGLNSPPGRSLAAITMLQPASAQLTPEMGAIPAPPAAACTVSSMSCQRALFGRCTRTEIEAYFAKAELSLLMRPSPFM